MKKLFALMIAVCLMALTTVALADSVLQDGQPPRLVTQTNESGETVYATILDAQGNAVAQITDENALLLVDVSGLDAADARLANALQNVTDAMLHGDVLADLDAHDLVIYDLFDVCLSEDAEAQITQDGSIEMKLEAHPMLGAPAAALYTADGTVWQAADVVVDGDVITVTIPGSGVVALLCDAQTHQDSSAPADAAADSEASGNFTPSVSGKPAPEAVTSTGADGAAIIGYIHSENGGEPIAVPDQNYVQITAVSQRDHIADILTHEQLEQSYKAILSAANVGALPCDRHEGTLAEDLDATLQQAGLTHDQLVVKDLFALTAYGDYLHALCDDANYLELTLDPQAEPGAALIVIHSVDGTTWHVHEDAVVNADGTVTLSLYDLGIVAFLVEAEYQVDAEGAVQAP